MIGTVVFLMTAGNVSAVSSTTAGDPVEGGGGGVARPAGPGPGFGPPGDPFEDDDNRRLEGMVGKTGNLSWRRKQGKHEESMVT